MKPHLRIIALIGLIVPRRLRADWRLEWESELRHREALLADWDRLGWRQRIDLCRRSTGAFMDALWLQRRWLEEAMVYDLRFGIRMMLKTPVTTLVAIVTLALGIGANTAIFSLLDRVLIQRLPARDPDRLVTFAGEGEPLVVSYPLYELLRGQHGVLAGLAAYDQGSFSLNGGQRSERVTGLVVSGNYFDVVGVRPAVGRFFSADEDRSPGTHPVVVISHGLWQRRFGADPAIAGRSIDLNAHQYSVIGVTPSEFTGTVRGTSTDVYVPVMMQVQAMPGYKGFLTNANASWLRLIGRLGPGVTRAQAQAALSIAADDRGPTVPPGGKDRSPATLLQLTDGSRGDTDRVADLRRPLQLLMGVVGFVLLVSCANVANLLLGRSLVRRREMAVRRAVGATGWRIARQSLTEGAMLALLGGAAGLLVAGWSTNLLLAFEQQMHAIPRTFSQGIDARTLAFTLGVSLFTAVLFGLIPALRAATPDLVRSLKGEGVAPAGRRWNTRSLLVGGQVALSLVVLVGAGLFLKSLARLHAIDPGFEPARVVTASFDLHLSGYSEARGRQFTADALARVGALPGVEAVSVARMVAFSDLDWVSGAGIEGYQPAPGERLAFDFNAVGPEYFRTLGARVLRGREFTARDAPGTPPVVIVNEAAAARYWPGQDPVGRRTSRGEVVGVVPTADTRA